MAQTGTITYTQESTIVGHQTINAAATWTKFKMIKRSGAWPTVPFKINSAILTYTKRNVGYDTDISYWKLSSQTSSAGNYLGYSGSYWSGVGNVGFQEKDPQIYKGDYTGSGSYLYLGIYADNSGVTRTTTSTPQVYDPETMAPGQSASSGQPITTVTTTGGGNAGQIQGGTTITLTIKWELTEAASTFTVSPESATFGGQVSASITTGIGVSYHRIRYTVGEMSTGWQDPESENPKYNPYIIPLEWMNQVTSSTTGTLQVDVQSYSSNGRVIGTTTKTIQISIPSTVIPLFEDPENPGQETITVTPVFGLSDGLDPATIQYVARVSKVQFTITAYGADGALITSIQVTGRDMYDTASITPATTVTKVVTSDTLQTAEQGTYTITAIDSRGRIATTTRTITIVPYEFPAIITLDLERYDSSTSKVAPAGTSLQLTSQYRWSDQLAGNSLTTIVYYKEKDTSVWIQESDPPTFIPSGTSVVLSHTFLENKEYDIRFEIYDTASALVGRTTIIDGSIGTGITYLYMQRTKRCYGIGSYTNGDNRVYISPDLDFWVHDREIKDYLLDLTHPIGSIWMTAEGGDNPNQLFGGYWVRIKDRFLLAAGDDYTAGDTGGSATHTHATGNHTLTAAELPQHYHTYLDFWTTSWDQQTSGRYAVAVNGDSTGTSGAQPNNRSRTGGVAQQNTAKTTWVERSGSNIGQAHNHGDTDASSTMPPYLVVYVWKRVTQQEYNNAQNIQVYPDPTT